MRRLLFLARSAPDEKVRPPRGGSKGSAGRCRRVPALCMPAPPGANPKGAARRASRCRRAPRPAAAAGAGVFSVP